MRIKSARRITPEISRCIEVDSPDRLFAAGGTDGKSIYSHNSVAQRNIVFSCILRPEHWRFLGIDLKRVELSSYRSYSNVVLGIATTLEDAVTVLRFGQTTMMKRYTEMETLGVNNFLDLPNRGQALMIMIDEAGELLGSSGVKALASSTYIPNLNGRRNISEIETGDIVFDNFGQYTMVLDKYIPEQQEQFDLTLANAHSISSGKVAHEVIRTGADHYWVVTSPSGEEKLLTTRELFAEIQISGSAKAWKIQRVVNGVESEKQNLTVSPKSLGLYLSGQLPLDEDDMKKLGLKPNQRSLPDRYLYSSREQRLELLEGIFGLYSEKPVFITEDPLLIQDVQRVVASLGFVPLLEKSNWGTQISYRKTDAEEWFEIESLVEIPEDSEQDVMYCLKVDSPSSQFLCTENFIPTHNTDEGKEQDLLKGEASMIIGSVARLGRAAGVHLVIATQRPDATLIPGETKANLGVRLNAGRSDSNASSMILGNGEGTRVKPNPRGRLYLSIYGRGDHGQGFFAEQSWIDDYLESKGLNPDGSPLAQKKSRLTKLTNFDSEFGEGVDLDKIEGVDNTSVIEKIRQEEESGHATSATPAAEPEDDWGFDDDDEAAGTTDSEAEESEAPARSDSWGGLELGGGNTDKGGRPEDDWDNELDALINQNYDN